MGGLYDAATLRALINLCNNALMINLGGGGYCDCVVGGDWVVVTVLEPQKHKRNAGMS